jgi:cytochrome c biogenesis protein CcdA
MSIKKFKTAVYFTFILILIIISFQTFKETVQAADNRATVLDVTHSSPGSEVNGSLSVTIEFQDVTEISSVRINFCSIEPFFCFYTTYLNYTGDNTYSGLFQDFGFKTGTTLIYNFDIKYIDDSSDKFPNNSTLNKYDNLFEVAENIYYFTFKVGEITPEDKVSLESEDTSPDIDLVLLGIAFSAGLVAFFSPCNYPMLPSYISYYLGKNDSKNESKSNSLLKGTRAGAITTLGFFTVFGVVGIIVAYIGNESVGIYYGIISIVVGFFLIILGLLMLTKLNLSITLPIKAPAKKGAVSFYLFGLAYAIASLACVFPIFIMIVLTSFSSSSFANGILVFIIYTLGLAIPMMIIAIAVATSKDLILDNLKRLMPYIKKLSAVILILAGIYLIYLQYEYFFAY